jgi:(E)-4-hydroxy-3-methyl-but-2-enyl pyrophosphate reductase
MKIIVAKNLGFCSGVKRAIAIAEKSFKEDPKPVQFLGPLVHNGTVVEKLKRNGGKIVSSLKEIKSGTLITRAHGEILNPNKIKKILVRDATCPLVKRTQNSAKELFEKDYQVIIIGDKNHPEVRGIKEYTKNKAIVINSKREAERLKSFKEIGVVAQTTQDFNKVGQILKILREKSKNIQWINTICPEVISRQKNLSQILKKTDGVLVIGSQISANTRRLAEMVKNAKRKLFWINSLENLRRIDFKKVSVLGVVSGTSAPNWEIERIKKWLSTKQK